MSDAVVVGSGPNGLAAAVTLARAGLSVKVYELASQLGGGTRSAELTLPGFLHDVCSAIHPMALASPFFQEFGLAERMELRVPEISYAHPLGGGRAGIAYRDLERTVVGLGRDGAAYRRLFAPLLARVEGVTDFTQHPLLRIPRDPIAAFRYALAVAEQGSLLGNTRFRAESAPAMIAGVSAHSIGKIPSLATAGAGLLLGTLAHAGGWPVPIGGSQAIADTLAADLAAHGGEIVLNHRVESLAQLKAESGSKIQLLDVSANGLMDIAGAELPAQYIKSLRRFRYGAGACKVDFALSGPVPWVNPELAESATLHLGGTRAEIALSEAQVAAGQHPPRPYVLVSQPSPHDASRAPAGRQVLWSYCHVPAGSTVDMTEAVVQQIERFAPEFRDVILASKVTTAADYAQYNPNYVGGDFSAGAVTIWQLLKRPVISARPWRTPIPGLYLCSSSTAPGPSVHGLCGWYAAQTALHDSYRLPAPELSPASS